MWGDRANESPLFCTFAGILADCPVLCLSPFEDGSSWGRDVLFLGHNAVRNELSDMFVMYRSMADIGEDLSRGDVKASALWYRAFCKFAIHNVFGWHKEELIPRIRASVKLDREDEVQIHSLNMSCGEVTEALRVLYAKQARLSSELSRDADHELVRLKFVEIVCDAANLAFKIAAYMKTAETVLGPILDFGGGLQKQDRDELFKKLSLRIQEAGTEQIDIPMLVTWMKKGNLREWLTNCAIDHRNRPIPLWMYNDWQTNHYYERHRKLVDGIVAKAKRV